MATANFNLEILTPEKTVYSGHAVSLVAPGESGYLGILANHAPLITKLKEGKVVLKKETEETLIFHSKGKGFLEVTKNKVLLLADAVE